MVKYYKVLDKHGRSCHGGDAEWSLPTRNADGTWSPGEWMPPVEGDLEPCLNGYHVVTLEQLLDWLGERVFEIEVGEEILPDDDKSVARTCRLVRECTGWNASTARLFACDCAERVCLQRGQIRRRQPPQAIEVSKAVRRGGGDTRELNASRAAAGRRTGAARPPHGPPTAAARPAAEEARMGRRRGRRHGTPLGR